MGHIETVVPICSIKLMLQELHGEVESTSTYAEHKLSTCKGVLDRKSAKGHRMDSSLPENNSNSEHRLANTPDDINGDQENQIHLH